MLLATPATVSKTFSFKIEVKKPFCHLDHVNYLIFGYYQPNESKHLPLISGNKSTKMGSWFGFGRTATEAAASDVSGAVTDQASNASVISPVSSLDVSPTVFDANSQVSTNIPITWSDIRSLDEQFAAGFRRVRL